LGKHGVEISKIFFYYFKLFNTDNPLDGHVLGDFHGIGTPGRYHGSTRANKKAT
jgi:hypothetical protein